MIGCFIYYSNKITPINILPSPTPLLAVQSPATFSKVVRVIDGDTIEIENHQKVRYIGIDTSEIYPKVECYSQESKKENENLVLGKMVRLEKDVSETDKYGRLLRYVFVENSPQSDIFVNNELVRSGFAKIETVPPDVKYKNEFLKSETYAKEINLGVWLNCKSF